MQGKSVNGFTLQSVLGVGGMAEVWLAENKIGKKASVKILLSKFCDDKNVVSRFLTEAKVMVELNHPNIRQVYDYGEIDGRPCIIMEYLEGDDLKSRMKRGQRFTNDELVKWWNQLVSALTYTHQSGIVHRDIKPGNIFIDSNGNVRLLDFGIAKVRESISITQTGQKLGTLMYMSPEQVKDSKKIDYRTDIYSLAVTFVHLISAKNPYDTDTTSDFEISSRIVYSPMDLSGLPPFWRDLLNPYLNKDADSRPDLKSISGSSTYSGGNDSDETVVGNAPTKPSPTPTEPEPITEKPHESAKSNKKTIGVLIAVIAALLLGVGILGIVQKSKNNKKMEHFAAIYAEKLEKCNICIKNIVEDRDGNKANKHFIIESLLSLKELEDIEGGSAFSSMGKSPMFGQLFTEYRTNLRKARDIVNEKCQEQQNMGLTDNVYYKELEERLQLIDDIISQSTKGSAKAINVKKKNQ